MDKDTGGPAFPSHGSMGEVAQEGMTLRDYFAAKAMQGLISCPDWREGAGEDVGMDASDYTASVAYMMADAMLNAKPGDADNIPDKPAAQRQPLTEEQIDDIWNLYCDEMGEASINDAYDIARAIEAAHGITGEKT